MLYIIGLGLGDEKDITLRGLEAIKSCDALFLEAYTSILPGISKSKLVKFNMLKLTSSRKIFMGSQLLKQIVSW
jgi:diphthamide biosynthesis methyltransferase